MSNPVTQEYEAIAAEQGQRGMKHTPGPWKAAGATRILGCDARGQIYIRAKDVTIAAILDGEREANARLIASAPELLAALADIVWSEWMVGLHNVTPQNLARLQKARAVIEKAGQS